MGTIRKQCPFCGNISEIEVQDKALKSYNAGANIMRAFPELTDFEREVIITGMCGNCQEKVFHKPLPENADSWGKLLGECTVCGCSIYEKKDKKGDNHRCAQCYTTFSFNGTSLEELD